MLRGPQLLLMRQQRKDKGSVPLLLTPTASQECRGARDGPFTCGVPAALRRVWTATVSADALLDSGWGLAPASQLLPHVPREEALSQQGRSGATVTLQLLGPVRGERW